MRVFELARAARAIFHNIHQLRKTAAFDFPPTDVTASEITSFASHVNSESEIIGRANFHFSFSLAFRGREYSPRPSRASRFTRIRNHSYIAFPLSVNFSTGFVSGFPKIRLKMIIRFDSIRFATHFHIRTIILIRHPSALISRGGGNLRYATIPRLVE